MLRHFDEDLDWPPHDQTVCFYAFMVVEKLSHAFAGSSPENMAFDGILENACSPPFPCCGLFHVMTSSPDSFAGWQIEVFLAFSLLVPMLSWALIPCQRGASPAVPLLYKDCIHPIVEKAQALLQTLQVMPGLPSHAMPDACAAMRCKLTLCQSPRTHFCRSTLVCQMPFLLGTTKSPSH